MSRRYMYYLPLVKQSWRYCVLEVIIVVCGVIHIAACGWVVLSHVICDCLFGPHVKVIPCPRIYETGKGHLILSFCQPNCLGQLYSIVRGHIGRIHPKLALLGNVNRVEVIPAILLSSQCRSRQAQAHADAQKRWPQWLFTVLHGGQVVNWTHDQCTQHYCLAQIFPKILMA